MRRGSCGGGWGGPRIYLGTTCSLRKTRLLPGHPQGLSAESSAGVKVHTMWPGPCPLLWRLDPGQNRSTPCWAVSQSRGTSEPPFRQPKSVARVRSCDTHTHTHTGTAMVGVQPFTTADRQYSQVCTRGHKNARGKDFAHAWQKPWTKSCTCH